MEEEQLQRLIFFLEALPEVASVPREACIFPPLLTPEEEIPETSDQICIIPFFSSFNLINYWINIVNLQQKGYSQLNEVWAAPQIQQTDRDQNSQPQIGQTLFNHCSILLFSACLILNFKNIFRKVELFRILQFFEFYFPLIPIFCFIYNYCMSSQRLQQLSNTLCQTYRDHSSSKNRYPSRSKIHSQRESSRLKYQRLTNHSKDQQKALINHIKSARRPLWKQEHYRINNTFSVFDKREVEPFPHNNQKYNIQFLDRTLRGRSLKFASQDWGFFQKPKDKLFTDHYKPIVRNKRKYNEDYELRSSLFGETWVDVKHDHIMDQYKLQANPFRTPASNALISTMYKQRNNYRRL